MMMKLADGREMLMWDARHERQKSSGQKGSLTGDGYPLCSRDHLAWTI